MQGVLVQTAHDGPVHDVALHFSGTLLATCSSDNTTGVFYSARDRDDGGRWRRGCVLRDHSGPVTRVAWCPYGEHEPMLVTVGADRWFNIYRVSLLTRRGETTVQATRLSQSRGHEEDIITDVAFVPPQQYHTMLFSTASLDGGVRLYELKPQQASVLCRHEPERDALPPPPAARVPCGTGVTAIAWFPGAVEKHMTLATGSVSGCVRLYSFSKDGQLFQPLTLPRALGDLRCASPVRSLTFAPVVGRCFNLLAVCSGTEVLVLRLCCVSPSHYQGCIPMEVFRWPRGAASCSWGRSAALLYLVADDASRRVTVLRMRDAMDHSSWEVVAEYADDC